MKKVIGFLIVFSAVSIPAVAQRTLVTGVVKDSNGALYTNCTGSANFVNQNTTPGTGPPNLGGSTFQTVVPFTCDGHGVMGGGPGLTLADNNVVQPQPSQWNFSFCAPPSISSCSGQAPPLCASTLITITGSTQDISTQLDAVAPILPHCGGTGGVPGGLSTQVQFNNAGAFGGIPSAGTGALVLANGTSQLKPYIDTRDVLDCTYTNDSAAFLNSAWANGTTGVDSTKWMFPAPCHIKLANTWTIQNHSSFLFEGYSSPGSNGSPNINTPTISYCGPAGGTVVNMQRANSTTIENLIIDGQGSGCANGALAGLVYDITGPGTLNTTFGVIENIIVHAGQNGPHNPNFTGINFSPISAVNVEDFLIDHSFFYCESPSPQSNTESTTGILFNTVNTKNEQIQWTNVSGCTTGINTGPGGVRIIGGDFGNNLVDIKWTGNADPTVIDNITSEASGQAVTTPGGTGGHFPFYLANSHFAPSNFATPNKSTVSLGDTTLDTQMTLVNNGWDDPSSYSGVTGAFPLSSNTSNHVVMINNNLIGGGTGQSLTGVIASGNSQFILPQGHNFGADYTWLRGGYFRVGTAFTAPMLDAGYGFITSTGPEVNGFGYSNSQDDGAFAGGLAVGRDSMYLGNAHIVMSAVWPVQVPTIICAVGGTPGTTNYLAEVFAKNASNHRSGITDSANGGPNACRNAQATFSPTNSLTVTWAGVAGEVNGYDVVIINPTVSINQGWLAGSVAHGVTTLTITSGPGVFNYVFPNYYESARTIINGEAFTLTAPMTTSQTITSTLASGTAPLVVSSTTPVANLTTVPVTYDHTGAQQLGVHIVRDHCILGTSCSVTLTGAAVFTSNVSYTCAANDQTGNQPVNFSPTSGSAFTFSGTGTDALSYICVGN